MRKYILILFSLMKSLDSQIYLNFRYLVFGSDNLIQTEIFIE